MTQSKRLFTQFTGLGILLIATTMHCNQRHVNDQNSLLLPMSFFNASALANPSVLGAKVGALAVLLCRC